MNNAGLPSAATGARAAFAAGLAAAGLTAAFLAAGFLTAAVFFAAAAGFGLAAGLDAAATGALDAAAAGAAAVLTAGLAATASGCVAANVVSPRGGKGCMIQMAIAPTKPHTTTPMNAPCIKLQPPRTINNAADKTPTASATSKPPSIGPIKPSLLSMSVPFFEFVI